MNPTYLATARLMIEVAPTVFAGGDFALKGGTAINLFYRDMPRLSVDLDLVFVDHRVPRLKAIEQIKTALSDAADALRRQGLSVRLAGKAPDTKMIISRDAIAVKVEVNTVMRGTVEPPRHAALLSQARDTLLAELEIPVVSLADVYGGKLVAALDRQHPRDLFDARELLRHEGITPAIRRAFVVYLAAHNRPPHEVLFGNFKDVSLAYRSDFVGMTTEDIALEELLAAREEIAEQLRRELDADERAFLLSVVRNRIEPERLGLAHAGDLPGIQWKLQNLALLEKGNPAKFREQADRLAERLG
ncbi:MAG TPA: nucleotidyl transferase AbiEii/AbiGii toxin family protein [Vicinamibacterales bacterium]|nr:nucleotidyl transferase AbiEii/AbiGii toxin family protein [Vicinamibacterales bacterium]